MLFEVIFQTDQTLSFALLVSSIIFIMFAGIIFSYKVGYYRRFEVGIKHQIPESDTNCPACGARILINQENCVYCGESIAK